MNGYFKDTYHTRELNNKEVKYLGNPLQIFNTIEKQYRYIIYVWVKCALQIPHLVI